MVLVLMGRGDKTRMTFWLVITYDDMAKEDALSKSLREMEEEMKNGELSE